MALTSVLLDLGHGLELLTVVAGEVLDVVGRRNELDLVDLADDLARVLGLVVLLADVARLVVEQPVRVAHPGHAPKEHDGLLARRLLGLVLLSGHHFVCRLQRVRCDASVKPDAVTELVIFGLSRNLAWSGA